MNVFLIGSGGREHALAWALSSSPLLTKLYACPGNGGICDLAECVTLNVGNHGAVIEFCREKEIGLVIIGPEAPLVAGLADDLEEAGLKVFGPSKAAAQLEGSKRFTKELCSEHRIPTAAYAHFTEADEAKDYVQGHGVPVVIKADGLAAGKGVIIAETVEQAISGIDECFDGAFGDAGAEIVIEDFLIGEEASFFVLVDGETALPLATAQDHKRIFNGDQGPNTGGMGAYSPAPVMSEDMCQRAMDEIIMPTVDAMRARGMPYKGVLYAGLMITEDGPELIEYNVRFGDPECQVLMIRLKSDLLAAFIATADGTLSDVTLEWREEAALTVVMSMMGYPGPYEKGSEIGGLESADANPDVQIFHAGTKRDGDKILANGGRVLNVTALGENVSEAQARAYEAIEKIDWEQGYCRTDIGWRAVERE